MGTVVKVLVISAALFGIVALIGLMAFGLYYKAPVSGLSGVTRVNRTAPDFSLPLYGEGELELAELRGNPIVLNFWASWCSPCREEAISLQSAWQSYRDRGVRFIGINIQDSKARARIHIDEFSITYPNGPDLDGTITVDYGVIGIPVTFFVNSEGVIKGRWVGALDEYQLDSWLDGLSSNTFSSSTLEGANLEKYFRIDK